MIATSNNNLTYRAATELAVMALLTFGMSRGATHEVLSWYKHASTKYAKPLTTCLLLSDFSHFRPAKVWASIAYVIMPEILLASARIYFCNVT